MSGEIDFTRGFVLDESGEPVTMLKLNRLIEDIVLRVQAGSIGDREIADGSIGRDKLEEDIDEQISLPDGAVTTSKLAAAAVTGLKIHDSVAGDGLAKDGSDNLEVSVDDSTIEITGDALQVKDSGVDTAKIADDAIETVKIGDGEVTQAKLAQPQNVVCDVKTDRQHIVTGNLDSWQTVSGLSVSITPSSASSTVLIHLTLTVGVELGAYNERREVWVRLKRGGTPIFVGEPNANGVTMMTSLDYSDALRIGSIETISFVREDSPAATSAQVYTVEVYFSTTGTTAGGAGYINGSFQPASQCGSSLVAQEISG